MSTFIQYPTPMIHVGTVEKCSRLILDIDQQVYLTVLEVSNILLESWESLRILLGNIFSRGIMDWGAFSQGKLHLGKSLVGKKYSSKIQSDGNFSKKKVCWEKRGEENFLVSYKKKLWDLRPNHKVDIKPIRTDVEKGTGKLLKRFVSYKKWWQTCHLVTKLILDQ